MTVHFTSDLHIGHARINELAGRPFTTVEEMNAVLCDRWCAVVQPEDDVIIIGDLVMGPLQEGLDFFATFPGRKLLVPGNHDRVSSLYRGSDAKKLEWAEAYRNAGITLLDERTWMTVAGTSVRVCHFPYEGDSQDDDRYASSRPKDTGYWLLHGHVHEKWKFNGRQINVGVDVWDFTPVSEDALAAVIAGSVQES